MELHRIDELPRYRHMGVGAFWTATPSISPEQTRAAMQRAHRLRSQVMHHALGILGRLILATVKRAVPRLPTGAHGPDAIDFNCAHGRPC